MDVRDITVQFIDFNYISDAVGVLLFHCFIKYFICLLQEGAYGSGYIEHKVQLFYVFCS